MRTGKWNGAGGFLCWSVETTPDRFQMNAANTRRPDVVLVIDDTSEIFDSIQELLESRGCAVHATSSSIEGIKLYETPWRGIRLVLSESFAQTLRDDEVIERLQRINPTVRVVFISGRDRNAAEEMLSGRLRDLLHKPLVA
jgi:CheY-like chemotaxis protein